MDPPTEIAVPEVAAPVTPVVETIPVATPTAAEGATNAAPSKPVEPGPVTPTPAQPGIVPSPSNSKDGLPEPIELATATFTGPASNPLALRHERLIGTISKFVTSSGWGFVKSHLFEGELGFKTENVMLECQNYEFKEGEDVEFDVQADERGRPHAVVLKPIVNRKPQDCIGQRHRGYVRRFADRWGFLNAAAFDGDLFVHRDNLLLVPEQLQDGQPPLRSGQAVEFDVAQDDRGRTVAKQITTSALLRPCDWIGRRMHGVIRSFQGAWGFINCDRFAGDLFVHRDSLLGQYQGVELGAGTMVEFDVERDHHKKGGKNRLVARQVSVLHQPLAAAAQQAAVYGTVPPPHMLPQAPYATMPYAGLNAQAATFSPCSSPLYYQGAPAPLPDPQFGVGYGQPPLPYPYDPHYAAAHHQALLQQVAPQALPPPQYGAQPHYGQPPLIGPTSLPGQPPYAQPPLAPQYGQPPYAQLPYAAPPLPFPGIPGGPPTATPPAQVPAEQPDANSETPQVLLHITTHDWEPDQAGQLRVRKGTLVNVSHRAAHGWVYAATVKHGEQAHEPPSEGWVPQAVAKRVSLCRVAADWPEEGPGTLGLLKGDLIAVSKEAERGWVYGERITPKRPDLPSDGWLPKKVLEYILM